MAQVKTESKEIFLALSLQLREPMNLLEKERMLLGHTRKLYFNNLFYKCQTDPNSIKS